MRRRGALRGGVRDLHRLGVTAARPGCAACRPSPGAHSRLSPRCFASPRAAGPQKCAEGARPVFVCCYHRRVRTILQLLGCPVLPGSQVTQPQPFTSQEARPPSQEGPQASDCPRARPAPGAVVPVSPAAQTPGHEPRFPSQGALLSEAGDLSATQPMTFAVTGSDTQSRCRPVRSAQRLWPASAVPAPRPGLWGPPVPSLRKLEAL